MSHTGPTEHRPGRAAAFRRLGAVFAGGRATRFGDDKALAVINGRTLIEWSMGGLRDHVAEIAVCGRDWPAMLCLADRPSAGLGPLGALNAALHYGSDHGFDAVLTTGCDIPFYPGHDVERLIAAAPAIIDSQPLIGCWPVTLAPRLAAYIASGAPRSLYGWAEVCGAARIPAGAPILNINTREDLARYTASIAS